MLVISPGEKMTTIELFAFQVDKLAINNHQNQ